MTAPDRSAASALDPALLDALHGVRVEHVEVRADGRIVLAFGARGTDDADGYLVVEPHEIHFANPEALCG